MVRRFNEGDLVLAKVAGSPPWPAVVRPCQVTDDDESFKHNGQFYRRPDWFWVLFFEDSVEPQSGVWVRSSKIRVLSYKDDPVDADDESLLEAHKYAERYFEAHRPDDVEQHKEKKSDKSSATNAPNGQTAETNRKEDVVEDAAEKGDNEGDEESAAEKHNPEPGSTVQESANSVQNPRRSSRTRGKKASTSASAPEKRTATERSSTSRSTKRRRGGGNAPAQKRPRRNSVTVPREMEEGDMEMTPNELRKTMWNLRKRNNELEEMIANVKKAIAPRRTK